MSDNRTLKFNFNDDGLTLTELTPNPADPQNGTVQSISLPFAVFAELIDELTMKKDRSVVFKKAIRSQIDYAKVIG
jgi:hypothetical protein